MEDSWTDVRAQMDGVIRQCMKVSTIGSGDDIREKLDTLEIEIRRLKTNHTFLRAVAGHERLITQARGGLRNKSSAAASRAR